MKLHLKSISKFVLHLYFLRPNYSQVQNNWRPNNAAEESKSVQTSSNQRTETFPIRNHLSYKKKCVANVLFYPTRIWLD